MIVIWGSGLYGTVHRVPGLCRTETAFAHMYFFPLFPMRTYLVLDGGQFPPGTLTPAGEVKRTRYGIIGIRVRLSWLSVLMTYARILFAVVTLASGFMVYVLCQEVARGSEAAANGALITAVVAAAAGVGLWLSRVHDSGRMGEGERVAGRPRVADGRCRVTQIGRAG